MPSLGVAVLTSGDRMNREYKIQSYQGKAEINTII